MSADIRSCPGATFLLTMVRAKSSADGGMRASAGRHSLRRQLACRAQAPQAESAASEAVAPADSSSKVAAAPEDHAEPPTILTWREPDDAQKLATRASLVFALPQRRFKKNSFLCIKLEGAVNTCQSHGPSRCAESAAAVTNAAVPC